MNAFDQMRDALQQAQEVDRAARANANKMVELLSGRLDSVDAYKLQRLKKELRKFNAHTGRWRNK